MNITDYREIEHLIIYLKVSKTIDVELIADRLGIKKHEAQSIVKAFFD